MGWLVNELEATEREELLGALLRSVEAGAKLLLLEPLAGGVSPWWSEWEPRFAGAGVAAGQGKWKVDRPAWVEQMDRASALDHRSVGARYFFG